MNYCVLLKLKIRENEWRKAGECHVISWNIRDLIAASSGWTILNEENFGPANSFLPVLQKGILELSQHAQAYIRFEVKHGVGTIRDTLLFYKGLLNDCKDYPLFDLYGYIDNGQ